MTCHFQGVLLLVNLIQATVPSAVKICVDNFGSICSECGSNVTLNSSLQLYLDQYDEAISKEIVLCSTEVALEASVVIDGVSSVSVDSYYEFSTISCSNERNFGIHFVNTENVTLKNIRIRNCGAIYNSTSSPVDPDEHRENLPFQTSVYFLNSSTIEICDFTALENRGIGLTLIDCRGLVVIKSSSFERNFAKENGTISGGNGVYIEFTSLSDGDASAHYILEDCTFNGNKAHTEKENQTSYNYGGGRIKFYGLGRGGGLCIHFKKSAQKHVVNITNCNFTGNEAIWGGGLFVSVYSSASDNEISIDNAIFSDNLCTLNGGGGIDVGFLFSGSQRPQRNTIEFSNLMIHSNEAEYGGGALVYSGSSLTYDDLMNEVMFVSCSWTENRALIGAAVHLVTHTWDTLKKGFLPTPVFRNCLFKSNYVDKKLSIDGAKGKGICVAVGVDVIFQEKTTFSSNDNTALYLVTSNAKFMSRSTVIFEKNKGKIGGAIVIMSLSSIEINDNSNFMFLENRAREKGGAIYHASHNVNDYVMSKSCFIQYMGNRSIEERNIHFTFRHNRAGTANTFNPAESYGNSIYTSTLRPCFTGCRRQNLRFYNQTFNCTASFNFDGKLINYQISTSGKDIHFTNKSRTLNVIPGEYLLVPVTLQDEVGNEVDVLYHVYLENTSLSTMSLSEEYISDKWIQVFGHSGDAAVLQVETVAIWEVAASFPIKMSNCPPGFALAWSMQYGRNVLLCECKAASDNKLFDGITDCNEDTFNSSMRRGFWYGYDSNYSKECSLSNCDGFGKERCLVSGYCPPTYCPHVYANSTVPLPNSTNITELDILMCGKRTGRLCASCRGDLSTLYHTNTFECFSSDKCKYGPPLYLATEIVPITIFFVVTILLDISFTHGAINGLIFYFQVTDISIHITSGFVKCSPSLTRLQEVYLVLSGVFSLKFFYHPDLSYCLWDNLQTLDILAFRYVSIVYALCLVVAIIIIMRACSFRRIARKFPRLFGKGANIKTTIIHGLSGFLVICYSECSKISLLLLTPVDLHYTNDTKTVVLFNGNLDYFKGPHWKYALPALFFLIVVGFIPPLVFLSYPLCYRIFALLRISESKFTELLCRVIPFERLRPFFDSFQSSFKDEYRFYSGLYFLYRMVTLLTFVVTRSITNYLTVLLIEFSVILCLHAIIQPYKKRWHNILDGCVFTNLIFLTSLMLLSYKRTLEYSNTEHIVEQVCVFQTLFLYAPLVFFFVTSIIKLLEKLIKKIRLMKIMAKFNADTLREQELSESLLFVKRD